MKAIKSFFLNIVRFFVVWFVDTISLLLTAWVMPGISILQVGNVSEFVVATVAALLLGVVNLLIRPLLLLITVPLGWMVVFLVGFFINAITLRITSGLMEGFEVSSWWVAFFGGRFSTQLSTNWSFIGRVDYGLGAGKTNKVWNLNAMLAYRFKHWGSAFAGYKWMDYDYENSTRGLGHYGYDASQQGPLLGLIIHW